MKPIAAWVAAGVALGLTTLGAAEPGSQSQASHPDFTATVEQTTRLAAVVPPGVSPQEACTGFQSVGECAAALHASQNLNIPFASLKSKVTAGQRLGAAIHALRPRADQRREEQRAEAQAHRDTAVPET
jgi:hypothetical protein